MKQLADLRKRAGLTQAELAQALGVDRTTVARWETAARAPSLEDLRRVLDALDATPEDRAALLA